MHYIWLVSLACLSLVAELALTSDALSQAATNETLTSRPFTNQQANSSSQLAPSFERQAQISENGHQHETDLRLEQAAYLINRDPEDSLLSQEAVGHQPAPTDAARHRLSNQLEQLAAKERLASIKVLTAGYRPAGQPNEPYPSASFTSMLTSKQQPNVSSLMELPVGGQSKQLIGISKFDPHESPLITSSGLNTGLIQNLTASLFPIKQLSNATLISLSELLNRTRHSQSFLLQQAANSSSSTGSLDQRTNQEPPIIIGQRLRGQPQGPLTQTADALMDYLRPSAEQLRHLAGRYQSAMSQLPTLFAGPSSAQPKVGSDPRPFQSYSMSPSSLLNTIMQPFSPKDASSNALDMAFYESLFDESTQRPLPMGSLKSYLELTPNHNQAQMQMQQSMGQQPPSRPNIVGLPPTNANSKSPAEIQPSSSQEPKQQMGSIKSTGGSMLSPTSRHKSLSDGDEGKLFGSIGSPSSTDSRSEYQPGQVNGSSGIRFMKDHPSSFVRQLEPSSTQMPPIGDEFDHFDSRFIGASVQRPAANHSTPVKTINEPPRQNRTVASAASQSPPSNHALGQAGALFDIYEREIDTQIKEALYGARDFTMQEARPPLRPFSVSPSSAPNWLRGASTTSPSTDEEGGSWPGSVMAMSQLLAAMRAGSKASVAPLDSAPSTPDPLVAALQELPTFAASDLQPLAYGGGSTSNSYPGASHSLGLRSVHNLASFSDSSVPLLHQDTELTGHRFTRHHYVDQNKPQHNSHASQHSGTSILGKLLGAPLGHLYSKSRNRRPQQQQAPRGHASSFGSQASGTAPSGFLFPLASKNLFSVLGSDGNPVKSSNFQQAHMSQANQQRAQRQQVAAAMANFMATAEAQNRLKSLQANSLSPLQLALLQSQASNQLASYQPMEFYEGHALSESSPLVGAGIREVEPTSSTSGPRPSLVPFFLRKLFSPATWARKQSISSSTTPSNMIAASQWQASLLQGHQIGPQSHQGLHSKVKQHDHLVARGQRLSGGEISSQVNSMPLRGNMITSNGGKLTMSESENFPTFTVAAHKRPPARVAIKILKIPVAYYEPLPSGSQRIEMSAQRPTRNDEKQAVALLLSKMVAHLQQSSAPAGGAGEGLSRQNYPQVASSKLMDQRTNRA